MLFISCFLLSLHLCHASGREVRLFLWGKYAKAVYVNTPKFAILHWFNFLNFKKHVNN